MRIEIINGVRVEYPDRGKWLHNGAPDYTRIFEDDYIMLGKDAEPWAECTNEEKEQWEEEHRPPQPEPETVE